MLGYVEIMYVKLFRIIAFVLLLVCGVAALRWALKEQLIYSDHLDRVDKIGIRNAGVLTHAAQQKLLVEADPDGALQLVRQALSADPFHIPAWLDLVVIYHDKGDHQKALSVFEYVDRLTLDIKRWRWEKAMVAYQTGLTAVLPRELHYIIHEIPGKDRKDALRLAFILWPNAEELASNVGSDNLLFLFDHAVRNKLSEQALYFWQAIQNEREAPGDREQLALFDMLLNVEQISEAAKIWRENYNPDTLLYNGNFSQKILQRAFGWRINGDKSFETRFESAGQGRDGTVLSLRFKGTDNLNFHHLFQIVPLKSGAVYELSGEMRSKNISTDQRPFWEVYGYKCDAPHVGDDMVPADQDWQRFRLEFAVPVECSAMVVRLRRKQSRLLNNKLSGRLWIRGLSITEIGADTSLMDYRR